MFRPKLLDALRKYDWSTFFADLAAGVTVGIVALPLAIGFGIASGVTPGQGLLTAIIAGFLISALGGSLVQVGEPMGVFVPILARIVAAFGYGGLAVAAALARAREILGLPPAPETDPFHHERQKLEIIRRKLTGALVHANEVMQAPVGAGRALPQPPPASKLRGVGKPD